MANDYGISTKTLLTVVGLIITPALVAVAGLIQLNVRLAGLEADLKALGVSVQNTMENQRMTMEYRIDALEALSDRWTDHAMDAWVKQAKAAFKSAGVDVELPDAFEVKRGAQ